MLSQNALVVVADGHSATLFRNTAKRGVALEQVSRLSHGDLTGGPVAQPDEVGIKDSDEQAFAARLARHLNDLVLKNKADEVVVVADPSTLGVMRKHYHKELSARITREVPKTLTNADLTSIEQAVA